MASLLLAILLLPAPAILPPGGDATLLPLLRSIDLDAGTLLGDPALLAADTLALVVTSRRQAYYKLSERGEVLATGQLLPGPNSLRFARPGLSARSQSLFLVLDLLEGSVQVEKFIRLKVTIEGRTEPEARVPALSGNFNLEMYHAGRLIGFRRKRMQDLVKLTTGPGAPAADPLAGASFRPQPSGNSVPVLGLAMALARQLAKKQAEKKVSARAAEMSKRRLETVLVRTGPDGAKRQVPIVIELRTE
jgi:hypothetical protein